MDPDCAGWRRRTPIQGSKKENIMYKNQVHWDDPAPSMDDKDLPSPPLRTTEEYERDMAAGIVVPIGRVYKPVIVHGKEQ
jgi:hypothetical protein